MQQINWKKLMISLSLSLGAGALSALLTKDSMEQYKMLYQPPLAPPGFVFPIVWTILYFLMGIAAYLVWNLQAEEKKQALTTYLIQLILNVGWSVIFFRFHAYLVAFVWLLLLWYAIFLTIRQFYAIHKTVGKLLFPYLIWVTFAGYLNLSIALHEM